MKAKKLWVEIAKRTGTTPKQARRDAEAAIKEAYLNPPSTEALLMQNAIPRKGAIPTPEEVILYCSMQVRAKLNEEERS